MTATIERVNEAREVALEEAKSLEDLEKYAKASDWSEVPSEYIKDHDLSTDELNPSELIGNWWKHDIYDTRVTFDLSTNSLNDVQVATALFGPTVWLTYNGNADGFITIEAAWGEDRWQSWAKAPSVAEYMWQVAEGYELAKV